MQTKDNLIKYLKPCKGLWSVQSASLSIHQQNGAAEKGRLDLCNTTPPFSRQTITVTEGDLMELRGERGEQDAEGNH